MFGPIDQFWLQSLVPWFLDRNGMGLHPEHLLAWAWWVLLGLILGRDRQAWIAIVGALVLRLAFLGPLLHVHAGRGYLVMNMASNVGTRGAHPYGFAWHALMLHPLAFAGDPPHGVQAVNIALGAFAAGLAVVVARRVLGDDDRFAWVAGAVVATLPLHVATSGTEHRFVFAATLQLAAVAGVLRRDRTGDLAAIASAALLAFLRPVQGAPAAVVLLAALVARRPWAVVGIGGFLAYRLSLWWPKPPTLDTINRGGLVVPAHFPRWGRDAVVVMFDHTRFPVGLALVVAGALAALRRRPWVVLFVGLIVVDTMFYASQTGIPDRLRMQVPAHVWIGPLAAVGFTMWHHLSPRVAWATLVVAAVTYWPARQPYPPYTWQSEHALLLRAMPLIPAGATVVTRPGHDHDGMLGWWAEKVTDADWVVQLDPDPDAYVWVTSLDRHGPDGPVDLTGRPEILVETVPGVYGGLEAYWGYQPQETYPDVTVGLYGPVETTSP